VIADAEVLERALRQRAPELVGGNSYAPPRESISIRVSVWLMMPSLSDQSDDIQLRPWSANSTKTETRAYLTAPHRLNVSLDNRGRLAVREAI